MVVKGNKWLSCELYAARCLNQFIGVGCAAAVLTVVKFWGKCSCFFGWVLLTACIACVLRHCTKQLCCR